MSHESDRVLQPWVMVWESQCHELRLVSGRSRSVSGLCANGGHEMRLRREQGPTESGSTSHSKVFEHNACEKPLKIFHTLYFKGRIKSLCIFKLILYSVSTLILHFRRGEATSKHNL